MRTVRLAISAAIAFSPFAQAEERTAESLASEMTDAMVRCAATFEEASRIMAEDGKPSTAELLERQANGARLSATITLTTTDFEPPTEKTAARAIAEVESRIETLRLVYAALAENDIAALDIKLSSDMDFCVQPRIRDFQAKTVEAIKRAID